MSHEYICIRDCYYGPPGLRKLFKIGEMLPENWEPNKHFLKGAKVPPEETGGRPTTPGDDPRSTTRMINDLLSVHKIDMKGKPRKEVFAAWIEAESAKEGGSPKEVVPADPGSTGQNGGDPFEGKAFSTFTPDQISNAKREHIVTSINHRFKLDMTHGGKSKAELVQKGIDLETRQTGARAI